MFNPQNYKKMETKKNKETLSKETKRKIYCYNRAYKMQLAVGEIINCTKYDGKYDTIKINEALEKIEDEIYNIEMIINI